MINLKCYSHTISWSNQSLPYDFDCSMISSQIQKTLFHFAVIRIIGYFSNTLQNIHITNFCYFWWYVEELFAYKLLTDTVFFTVMIVLVDVLQKSNKSCVEQSWFSFVQNITKALALIFSGGYKRHLSSKFHIIELTSHFQFMWIILTKLWLLNQQNNTYSAFQLLGLLCFNDFQVLF